MAKLGLDRLDLLFGMSDLFRIDYLVSFLKASAQCSSYLLRYLDIDWLLNFLCLTKEFSGGTSGSSSSSNGFRETLLLFLLGFLDDKVMGSFREMVDGLLDKLGLLETGSDFLHTKIFLFRMKASHKQIILLTLLQEVLSVLPATDFEHRVHRLTCHLEKGSMT